MPPAAQQYAGTAQAYPGVAQAYPYQAVPAYDPMNPYGAFAPARATGNGFSIAAIVLGCVAVLFLPIVFGPAAIILASVGKSRGERRSTVALSVAGGGMTLGFIVGVLVAVLM
ncbi:hypothetical protein [Symbioplanes lichenis]|uniref:hypothetical protein n=1 Tax=Symbioplanes lichenis TaxID=1629072 RepID=UPI00273A1FBE|nr:hypothetical protein [Actinoplanes lichenis]